MSRLRSILGILAACAVIFAAFRGYQRYEFHRRYPYGWSHCCIKGLGLHLHDYAERHGGRFPSGELCPEASLSLLARQDRGSVDAELLRGKTVPIEVTAEVLGRGELLGPESCGWHYVEGLTLDDDPNIAILWDKVGLGHNGEKGHHSVLTIGQDERNIPDADWAQFLHDQEALIAKSRAKRKLSEAKSNEGTVKPNESD